MRTRRLISALLLGALVALPLSGCARGGRGGPDPVMGRLMSIALGVGVSVGTYYLIKELD